MTDMENYVGKYIEIGEKDGLSVTCMLVTKQEPHPLRGEAPVLSGYGFLSAKGFLGVATFERPIVVGDWFDVKEITREEFLKKHETAWRTIRTQLTKKTYKQAKKLKQ